MTLGDALEAFEGKVSAGELRRLSGASRRTKGILYANPSGQSIGLDLGGATVEDRLVENGGFRFRLVEASPSSADRVRLVLEKNPPTGALNWSYLDGIASVERLAVHEQLESSVYQRANARLRSGQQQIVCVSSLAALETLLTWYASAKPASTAAERWIAMHALEPKSAIAPTNLILYGPPGTGKTFRTAEEAVRLCDGALPESDHSAVRRRYEELTRTSQIRFVTFHQSYTYEDFVEGLRPITGEAVDTATSAGFRLMPVPGVFREIATLAEQARTAAAEGRSGGGFDLEGRRFWKMALGAKGSEEHVYQAATASDYVALGWGRDVDFSDPRCADFEAMRQEWAARYPNDTTPSQTSQPWTLRNAMKVGDLVIVPHGNTAFRAIAEIKGGYFFELGADGTYNQRRKVRWLLVSEKPLPLNTIVEGDFTTRTLYEIPEDRILKEALVRLIGGPPPIPGPVRPDQFVLVIDEINRANVSKVFGELITLLEADKRLGRDNALTVTLPYSGDTFGVPDNLHVVGTMNTADRSIALLDTALRRRFSFRELAPQPEILSTNVEGIDLAAVLRGLNARIEYLVDREHRIGHAFFMGCRTRADVDAVMRERVIPLLAEYFFEDWERIRLVLGETSDAGAFLARARLDPPPGLDDPRPDRWRYTVREAFADAAYAQLRA